MSRDAGPRDNKLRNWWSWGCCHGQGHRHNGGYKGNPMSPWHNDEVYPGYKDATAKWERRVRKPMTLRQEFADDTQDTEVEYLEFVSALEQLNQDIWQDPECNHWHDDLAYNWMDDWY